jgi:hypothetical protein
VNSMVVWISCDFNEKSKLHFVLCRLLFLFSEMFIFLVWFFELWNVSPPLCVFCALVNACRLYSIQDPVAASSSECVPSLLHSRSSRSFFLWFCSLARIFSLNFSATGAARSWIFCWVRSLISSFGTRSLSFSRLLVLRSCFHFLRQGFGAGGFSLPSAPGFWRPVRQVFLVPHQFFLGGFLLPRAQIQFAAENFFHCC